MSKMASQPAKDERAQRVARLLPKRHRAEKRFKAYGVAAIAIAMVALATLLYTIISSGTSAFWQTWIKVEVAFDPDDLDPAGDIARLNGFLDKDLNDPAVQDDLRTAYARVFPSRERVVRLREALVQSKGEKAEVTALFEKLEDTLGTPKLADRILSIQRALTPEMLQQPRMEMLVRAVERDLGLRDDVTVTERAMQLMSGRAGITVEGINERSFQGALGEIAEGDPDAEVWINALERALGPRLTGAEKPPKQRIRALLFGLTEYTRRKDVGSSEWMTIAEERVGWIHSLPGTVDGLSIVLPSSQFDPVVSDITGITQNEELPPSARALEEALGTPHWEERVTAVARILKRHADAPVGIAPEWMATVIELEDALGIGLSPTEQLAAFEAHNVGELKRANREVVVKKTVRAYFDDQLVRKLDEETEAKMVAQGAELLRQLVLEAPARFTEQSRMVTLKIEGLTRHPFPLNLTLRFADLIGKDQQEAFDALRAKMVAKLSEAQLMTLALQSRDFRPQVVEAIKSADFDPQAQRFMDNLVAATGESDEGLTAGEKATLERVFADVLSQTLIKEPGILESQAQRTVQIAGKRYEADYLFTLDPLIAQDNPNRLDFEALRVPELVDPKDIDSFLTADLLPELAALAEAADYKSLVAEAVKDRFKFRGRRDAASAMGEMVSETGGIETVWNLLKEDWSRLGTSEEVWILASDHVDLFEKGQITQESYQGDRKVKDDQIIWLNALKQDGRVESSFNSAFLTDGPSNEAEVAGVWGAVVGSFLTLSVTLFLSFFVGVAAAIYLEEFAPKNKFTDLIEVNINNLAAVPSIVFGLLGLFFLNSFGTDLGIARGAPAIGGFVLALMTLPTIIIASRAALRAVPPSIREAALGMGASDIQTVSHHVLPLALPGILTGSIIGMAQALGETAPLLMIGMVAFVADIPTNVFDSAAAPLPVQIYLWSEQAERAFVEKTSATILVLLSFLVLMNVLAIFLRKKFERRW